MTVALPRLPPSVGMAKVASCDGLSIWPRQPLRQFHCAYQTGGYNTSSSGEKRNKGVHSWKEQIGLSELANKLDEKKL